MSLIKKVCNDKKTISNLYNYFFTCVSVFFAFIGCISNDAEDGLSLLDLNFGIFLEEFNEFDSFILLLLLLDESDELDCASKVTIESKRALLLTFCSFFVSLSSFYLNV